MKGIELARLYYLEHGQKMIREQFPELEKIIAVGLVGSGSECYGYDDDISQDHDFEPAFCLFIPDETVIDEKTKFALERAYAKLPNQFMGFSRCLISPVGGSRHGVIRIADFYNQAVGKADGNLTISDWFSLPSSALAQAVNGQIFRDDEGTFTAIRHRLSAYPDDVRIKKLTGHLITMAQAGQYNYMRCINRGETGAAQLAVGEFVNSAINVIFLLNNKYMPYYKWSFRALKELNLLGELSDSLEFLISSDNTKSSSALKSDIIEDISSLIIRELKEQRLTDAVGNDLERHAYSVNGRISDATIRNLNIFYAV